MTLTYANVNNAISRAREILMEVDSSFNKENHYSIEFTNAVSFWANIRKTSFNSYRIRVSRIFEKITDERAAEDRLVGCMIHEIIHSQKGCMNHGYNFQRWAEKVNYKYPKYHIQRADSLDEYGVKKTDLKAYRWGIACANCGKEWKYIRKPKIYDSAMRGKCSCPYCKGKEFKTTLSPN